MFTIVPVLIVLIVVVGIGLTIYRAVRLRSQGVNPLTLEQDLAAQALRSQALQPARSKADRLDELDRLRAMGSISEQELATARARVLSE
jgi:hypothetical protein